MLRTRQLLGYGAGDAANNLTYAMVGSFLLLYYTDVAHIDAAAAGTIFLVVRIWDGLADLLAGRLVDRTNTRWGKFRPWLLFGSLPLLLLGAACFWVPADWSPTGKLVYAYLTYIAFGTAYSLVNIPYGALAAASTQDPVQRSKLATARTMGAAATTLLLSVVISPQVKGSGDLQRTLLVTTLVFVVVGVALYLFSFGTAREAVQRPPDRITLRGSARALAGNRPLMLLCASSLAFLVAQFGLQSIGIYYARDVLGDPALYTALIGAQTGMYFLAPVFVPWLVRRIDKRPAYLLGCLVWTVGTLGLLLAPASALWLVVVCFGLVGAGLAVVATLQWSLEADTVEYGQWRTGTRAEGATYAVYSFVRKVGQALGGAAVSYTLALAGYSGTAAVQSPEAVWGIRIATGLIPGIAALIALAVMLAYPLSRARFQEITAELDRRRSSHVDAFGIR